MRQEVYRVAFDEAKAELGDILGKFDQLRLRKDRIEKLVEALKPLMGSETLATASDRSPATDRQIPAAERQAPHAPPEPSQAAAEPVSQVVQQASDTQDPFQRRVDNAVGLGSGARDIREYSRLFNGSSPR
ncbi:MAG: hypothetical protein WAM85_01170 [Terracidiphilus sp.]